MAHLVSQVLDNSLGLWEKAVKFSEQFFGIVGEREKREGLWEKARERGCLGVSGQNVSGTGLGQG